MTGSQEVRGSIPLVSTIVNAKAFGIPKAFFHAKTPHATNPTYANKMLHNLFPMSVHSLLDKRNYQCSSTFHLCFRSIPNHRSHPNNQQQREQHPKTTPLSTSNERYVVQHNPNQFRYQLVLGYLALHEFNCALRLQQAVKRRVDQHPAVTAVPETPRAPIKKSCDLNCLH